MKIGPKKDQKQVNERSPEKVLQKRQNNNQIQYLVKWKDQDEPTWDVEENIINLIKHFPINEQELQENSNDKQSKQCESQKHLLQTLQYSFKHPNCSEELLFNKQKEMTQKYCYSYPQFGDEIESVYLILTSEDCLFEIKWKTRSDGVKPISDFYQYDQFKVVAPMLFMDFLEICILGHEKSSDIKFIAPGKDNIERSQLIKRILLQNPKYVDTNKNQENEEVKVNDQNTLNKEKGGSSKKSTIITFMQSEQKQKQTIETQSQFQKQSQVEFQEQLQDDGLTQQEKQLEDKQSEKDNHQDESEKEQMVNLNQNINYEEQIEQESISLEQQQE
ncbi:unnamed protein product [Paramecium sonneborni]|uniref:Chromo domain-containing protein n=1 Tax=Paramecium sonneborni TaxID=65129 RepID=A0A8S1K9R8_9CILI|nr:unnamed protein product [Paramecium sonneborni]